MKYARKLSIDNLPIETFIKVLETGNVKELPVKRNHEKVWGNVFSEYIDCFGISESYKEYLQFKEDAIDLYFKAHCENKKFFITMAKIKDYQANEAIKGKRSSFNLLISSVSKFMGFRVNPKETSVKEFYQYVKLLEASTTKSNV